MSSDCIRSNLLAIAVNVFFILAHIAQTKFFYDGLAQDTHEATSLGSVVIMLFAIMLMENRRQRTRVRQEIRVHVRGR